MAKARAIQCVTIVMVALASFVVRGQALAACEVDGTPCQSDGIACTDDLCRDGLCTHVPNDGACDDGFACTTQTCNAVLGCQTTTFDDSGCDDGNPCTVDDCDGTGTSGCLHITRPDGVVVGDGEACVGASQCLVGELVCQGGAPVTQCPAYVDGIDALGDAVCGAREVAYAIVVDNATAEPIGTIRCWREVIDDAVVVDCDRAAEGSTEAKVYDGLYCPAQ